MRVFFNISLLLGSTAAAVGLVASTATAAPPVTSPEVRAAVRQMFADGWELSSDGLTTAERSYQAAKVGAPADARLDYAWALLQLKYLKFNEADRTLSDVLRTDAELWPARMLKIRLAVSMKKPTAALEQLEQLAGAAVKAAPGADRDEAIEFVGRIFAYFEGPGARGVAATAVADSRRRVVDKLNPTDEPIFERGFDEVNRQFLQLADDKQRSTVAAKEAETQQKEQDLQRLAAEQQNVDAQQDAVRAQADEVEQKSRAAVAQVDAELTPLNNAIAQINTQGQFVRAEIVRIDAVISSLLAQADATDDPALKASLRAQADLATIQIRRAEAEYRALDIQAAQINAQRGVLLQRRAQIVADYEAAMKQLGRAAVKLAGNEQRIASQTKTAQQPATGRTPQVQTKETMAASLATYVDVSLDREKQRLLESLE